MLKLRFSLKSYKGNDNHYNLWLDVYHPASVQLDGAVTLDSSNFHTPSRDHKQLKSKSTATNIAGVAKPRSVFEKLFTLPSPPDTEREGFISSSYKC